MAVIDWPVAAATGKTYRHFCASCEVISNENTCWFCGQPMEMGEGRNLFLVRDETLQKAHTKFCPEGQFDDWKVQPYIKFDWKKWDAEHPPNRNLKD